MMPIIRPLKINECQKSEYRKEQDAFAEMQADFHLRRASKMRGQMLRRWVLGIFRRSPDGLTRRQI